jgi:hypothetical protein
MCLQEYPQSRNVINMCLHLQVMITFIVLGVSAAFYDNNCMVLVSGQEGLQASNHIFFNHR